MPPGGAAVAALQEHPRFGEAIRLAAQSFLALYQGNRLANTVVNDRGRLIISYLCLFLHYTRKAGDPRSGLTAARIKALCVEHKVCSAGRAEAMLVLMRLFGYLAPAPSVDDRRTRMLVPTERMIAEFQKRWRHMFTAVAQVLPQGDTGLAALDRPGFTAGFVRHVGESFLAGFRFLDSAPGLELFADRNAGIMILFSLIAAGAPDDTVPPQRPVTVSLSSVSRRFGVSRAHVRKLLRDAADAGLVRNMPEGDSQYAMLPPLAEATRRFFATMFLFLASSIAVAIEEMRSADVAA